LPDGTEPPGGAAPAASEGSDRGNFNFSNPDTTGNQVSRDGSNLLFVSPDPGPNPAQGPTPQLYIRRGGHSTLVSHMLSGITDPAPSGVAPVQALNASHQDAHPHMYAYGSPDGKSVIFDSADVLAVGAPAGAALKAYSYDVATGVVSYLPGVGGGAVVASSDDGQRFVFGDSTHIAISIDGTIKTIATFPSSIYQLSPARATASGSVLLFSTSIAIPGFNNGTGSFIQVYRYDTDQDKLSCLSCPPNGTAPTGDAVLSNQDARGFLPSGELVPSRGLSDDGGRVFFDSPNSLVPRDTNGNHRDVYEWTPSGLSLISSGRSKDNSFFLDSSANGNDVFFTTTEGLDPADTDGAYDVFDARVGGGFAQTRQVAPCEGDACQGGASGAPVSPAPGSARIAGAGDQEPTAAATKSPAKLKLVSAKVAKSTLALTVMTNRPGMVSVRGAGLRSLTKSYAKAGTFKLSVALSAPAKRSLKARHRLRLDIRVGFMPQFGAASSVKLVLNAKA
jgi:hypothetical protein